MVPNLSYSQYNSAIIPSKWRLNTMKSTTRGNNNDILLREKSITVDGADQISFSNYIKEKRKLETSPSGKKNLSTRELAERLDIDYEQFRKILNMNKPTKKRDCIIAICAALRLNSEETDEALILYQYMPVLDPNNPRDDLLIEILEEQFSNPLTISAINQRLVRNGYPELDIIDHRPSIKPASEKNDAPYKLLKKQARTFSDDLIFGTSITLLIQSTVFTDIDVSPRCGSTI